MPDTTDYVADVLITRNKRQTFDSLFKSTSSKAIIRIGTYLTKIDGSDLGTTELFDDDEVRVDVVQTDTTIQKVWIVFRGSLNYEKDKRQQEVTLPIRGAAI